MTYHDAKKIYKKLPVSTQRDIEAAMIDYFQSAPLFIALTTTRKQNRQKRYFTKLIDDYLTSGDTKL